MAIEVNGKSYEVDEEGYLVNLAEWNEDIGKVLAEGEKIEMTAPVGQQRFQEKWAVSFIMPASYTLETLPEPEDPKVTLRQVPARRMAAVRYSGFWSEKGYLRYKLELESWIRESGLTIVGDPIWARYNPPFTPWFLRRNEILIPVDAGAD